MKKEEYHDEEFIEVKFVEPIHILLTFLLGIASILFVIGSIGSFNLQGNSQIILIICTVLVYLLATIVLLHPKKVLKKLPRDKVVEKTQVIERPVYREVEKPVIKYKEKPVIKEVIKEVRSPPVIAAVNTTKKEKKSKFMGSTYTESYHLRTCRFAGVIKPEYLIEEDDRKYFKLRGYKACKVCKPDKN